jgi:hypothetical protein
MEEWRQIVDYPNYSVSNFGNVRNDKKMKIVKTFVRKSGRGSSYLRFFRRGGPQLSIHILVATFWVENPDNEIYTQVDHVDRNSFNNHFSNLRWVTASQNSMNRRNKNTIKGAYKVGNRWRCSINNKHSGHIHLGYYDTREEAGLAYNQYVIENNLGEYCELNIL